tara:strand:+ start:48 stop:395 length:348 start_codon:yes stop_codon:yes gene_type:complete
MSNELYVDPYSEELLNKRLTEKRKGFIKIKPTQENIIEKKSSIYCNKCNQAGYLRMCNDCKNNLCDECLKTSETCISCYKEKKSWKSNKIYPNDVRNVENVKSTSTYKRYCCFWQ